MHWIALDCILCRSGYFDNDTTYVDVLSSYSNTGVSVILHSNTTAYSDTQYWRVLNSK